MNQIQQAQKATNVLTHVFFICFPYFSVQWKELEATSFLLMFQLSLKFPDAMIFTVICSNWNTPKSSRLNYPGGIRTVFQVRKQEHHVSATLFLGSHCQQEGLIIQCTGILMHSCHFPDLCNHFCIGSFTASLRAPICYEDKLSLSAEGQRLTDLSNDLSIILYESVGWVFFLNHPILNFKKGWQQVYKDDHYAFALDRCGGIFQQWGYYHN